MFDIVLCGFFHFFPPSTREFFSEKLFLTNSRVAVQILKPKEAVWLWFWATWIKCDLTWLTDGLGASDRTGEIRQHIVYFLDVCCVKEKILNFSSLNLKECVWVFRSCKKLYYNLYTYCVVPLYMIQNYNIIACSLCTYFKLKTKNMQY